MAGQRHDKLGNSDDHFAQFMYAAETKVGAASILQSARVGRPVRVFRSSSLSSRYAATTTSDETKLSSVWYRYDGLYQVATVEHQCPHTKHDIVEPAGRLLSPPVTGRLYKFHFERVERNSGVIDDDDEDASLRNVMDSVEHIRHCFNTGTMKPMVEATSECWTNSADNSVPRTEK